MENSFHEIKKRDEAEYIKRVQKILEKSKMEEENELISNKKLFLSEEKIKLADEQIKNISDTIKINGINPNTIGIINEMPKLIKVFFITKICVFLKIVKKHERYTHTNIKLNKLKTKNK